MPNPAHPDQYASMRIYNGTVVFNVVYEDGKPAACTAQNAPPMPNPDAVQPFSFAVIPATAEDAGSMMIDDMKVNAWNETVKVPVPNVKESLQWVITDAVKDDLTDLVQTNTDQSHTQAGKT